MKITIEEVAARCDKVRWNGKDSFTACCVAHDDKTPSMSVCEKDGTLLAHCHAGCSQEAVLEALGFIRGGRVFSPSPVRVTEYRPPATLDYAKSLWAGNRSNDPEWPVESHPYAVTKRIDHSFGARRGIVNGSRVGRGADCIIIPNRDWEGNLVGVECINGQGVKQSFGNKGLLVLGNPDDAEIIHVVEGWATAWAIGHLFPRPYACIVAFGKGKMEKYANDAKGRFGGRGTICIHEEGPDNRDVWDLWVAGEGEQYAQRVLRVAA